MAAVVDNTIAECRVLLNEELIVEDVTSLMDNEPRLNAIDVKTKVEHVVFPVSRQTPRDHPRNGIVLESPIVRGRTERGEYSSTKLNVPDHLPFPLVSCRSGVLSSSSASTSRSDLLSPIMSEEELVLNKMENGTPSSKEKQFLQYPTLTLSSRSATSSELESIDRTASGQSSVFRRELVASCVGHHDDCEVKGGALRRIKNFRLNYTINPHGSLYLWWMGVIVVAYCYNAIAIPLRASFTQVQGTRYVPPGELRGPPIVFSIGLLVTWIGLDVLFDVVYFLDMLLIQSRVSLSYDFEKKIKEKKDWMKHSCVVSTYKYFFHWSFWVDLVSLVPLEILYAVPILRYNPLLRLPRLLKIRQVRVFFSHFENSFKYPHTFRLIKTSGYLLYLIHIFSCLYYSISEREGFGSTEWEYNGEGNSYIRCFYFALLLVTTVHDREVRTPSQSTEYLLELFASLLGVFFVALIITNICSIVEAANHQKQVMRDRRDKLKTYLKLWKIPKQLQRRVEIWYNYAFTQKYISDENEVLATLPRKMRSDLVIHCILDTLSKVRIFQGFEKSLLRELVLKLRPVLFIPGDYICRKGEIGKEMYIVNHGTVLVLGGINKTQVLAELGPGSIFGEISLLAVGGGNRRTADVKSKGFANLFVLSKKDVHETLMDYPDAQDELKKKAKHLLKRDFKRDKHSVTQPFMDYENETKKQIAKEQTHQEICEALCSEMAQNGNHQKPLLKIQAWTDFP